MLTYEEKVAFHEATGRLLDKTEMPNIIKLIEEENQKGTIPDEWAKYFVTAVVVVSMQVRALMLGMDKADVQFTPEESQRRANQQRG